MTTFSATHIQNPLLTQPIALLIRRIGIPVGIGAFFNTMFNVVDTYYGGLISREVLAALSLSFPIYFVIIALGFGLSTGNTALIGNALGGGKREMAERYAIQGLVLGLLLALVVTVAGVMAAPWLYTLLGASGEYLATGLRYINPIFYGTIFFVFVQMLNSILNAIGQTKPYRNFLVAGFLLNLLLDPWFIYGGLGLPPMGITGIALATVLVQLLGGVYLLWAVARSDLISWASVRRNWGLQPAVARQILQQGLPNIIDLSSISIGFFILTFFVSQFGQSAVAAFGAAARIEQVVLLPLIGLDVATLSLIAQNNGAHLTERVTTIFTTALRYGMIIMFVGFVIVMLFAPQLMALFSDDAEVIRIGASYIRIKAWALFPSVFTFVGFAAMRGVKKPFRALILSMLRMVFIPLVFVYLFVEQWGYGLNAIWWIATGSGLVVGLIAYVYAQRLLSSSS